MLAVKIPGPTASVSKMSKKGWKCWALRVTGLDAAKALPWLGDRIEAGGDTSLEAGDLVLHVDESSDCGLGVALPTVATGQSVGVLVWLETAGSAKALTAAGKRLLALSPRERLAEAAKVRLASGDAIGPKTTALYHELTGGGEATAPAVDLSGVPTDALVRELARRGVQVRP